MPHQALLLQTPKGWLLGPQHLQPTLLKYTEANKYTLLQVSTEHPVPTVREFLRSLEDQSKYRKTRPIGDVEAVLYTPPPPRAQKKATVISKETYQEFLSQARKIQEYIRSELIKGRALSLRSLEQWVLAKEIHISRGGLSRHLQKAMDECISRGYTKVKEGREYRLTPP